MKVLCSAWHWDFVWAADGKGRRWMSGPKQEAFKRQKYKIFTLEIALAQTEFDGNSTGVFSDLEKCLLASWINWHYRLLIVNQYCIYYCKSVVILRCFVCGHRKVEEMAAFNATMFVVHNTSVSEVLQCTFKFIFFWASWFCLWGDFVLFLTWMHQFIHLRAILLSCNAGLTDSYGCKSLQADPKGMLAVWVLLWDGDNEFPAISSVPNLRVLQQQGHR